MAVQTSSSVLKGKKEKRENISFITYEIAGGTVVSWLAGVLTLAPDQEALARARYYVLGTRHFALTLPLLTQATK